MVLLEALAYIVNTQGRDIVCSSVYKEKPNKHFKVKPDAQKYIPKFRFFLTVIEVFWTSGLLCVTSYG